MRRAVALILLVLATGFVAEVGLRGSGMLLTYSERNFDRYDSYFDRVRPTDWFLDRGPVIVSDQAEFCTACPATPMGLRDEEIGKGVDSTARRFLVLGDSFTEGVGASCGSSMPARLTERSGGDTLAINAGVVGSDPFLSLQWYDTHFHEMPHDEVVLVMNFSDISDHVFWGGQERFDGDSVHSRSAPWFHGAYRRSHLVRAVVHGILRFDFALTPPWRQDEVVEEALAASADLITRFTQDHPDVPLTVVVHPYPFAVSQHVPGHDRLPDLGDRLPDSVRFIDLYPAFGEVLTDANHTDYSWPIDGHFNDAGYDLFARLLLAELRRSPGRSPWLREVGGG